MDTEIERAKAFLKDVLLFEPLAPWQTVKALLETARREGIPKADMKQARKELGVASITVAGEQLWAFPERVIPGQVPGGMA